MKISTRVNYINSIIAPSGKVFTEDTRLIREVCGDDTDAKVTLNGKCLSWTHKNINWVETFTDEDVREVFGKLLVDEDGNLSRRVIANRKTMETINNNILKSLIEILEQIDIVSGYGRYEYKYSGSIYNSDMENNQLMVKLRDEGFTVERLPSNMMKISWY